MAEANTPTTTTTSPSVSISDLPQLPLLTIFDYIPLRNLLHIDEVCRAWQEHKLPALLRRRHLTITNDLASLHLIEKADLEYHQELELIFDEIGLPFPKPKVRPDLNVLFIGRSRPLQTILDRVLELMPNLKVFRLVQQHGSPKELSKVNQLLAHYRRQLVEVKICFKGANVMQSRAEAQQAYRRMFLWLMASLNRLTVLRSLDLTFRSPPNCPVVFDDRQLATHCLSDVVGRLEWLKFCTRLEFSSSTYRNKFAADARLLNQVLFRMRDGGGADKALAGEGSKLKQHQPKKQENLELHLSETPLTLKTLISLGPGPVTAGLRTVKIDGIFSADKEAEYKALARLARQSPHLQALTVGLKCLDIRRLVESLASLTELVCLNICCYMGNTFSQPPVNIGQLPVMPSVKSLTLSFPANSHHDYEQLHLEVLFPNLKNVLWNHMGVCCQDCGYLIPPEELALYFYDPSYLRSNVIQLYKFKAYYGLKMQKCLRLARLAAFSRLPQLSYLFLQISPSAVDLPFMDEVFTSNASLYRQTEFLLSENSASYVVYKD